MGENGTRYLGDVLFDELSADPGFIAVVRELVAADWRTGTDFFRAHVEPLVAGIRACEDYDECETWGGLDYGYLARRVMEGLDPGRDPWLWVYATLIAAFVDPVTARTALNNIEIPEGS